MFESERQPLIVCFGDSLTAGYQSPSRDHPTGQDTPYGTFLGHLLGPRARVRISGICGEVTGEMLLRFRGDVLEHHPTHVVILGGTNDLGWNASPQEIVRNLIKMYELARAARVMPIPVTVPSLRMPDASTHEEAARCLGEQIAKRQTLNGMIQEYAGSKAIPWIDLFTATAEPDSLQLAPEYSNDGLHLTTSGYQRFANLLYDHVFSGLPPSQEG